MILEDLEDNGRYWYVYIDYKSANAHIKLLEVELNYELYAKVFYVLLSNNDIKYKSFPVDVNMDYLYKDKKDVEIILCAQLVKNLKSLVGVDIGEFFDIYKRLSNEFPELLIR